jgi:hypothetical protein
MRKNNAAQAAAQDTRLILQLERLRDETEMRKARRWWRDEFRPRSAGDYLKVEMAHGTKENRWLRQVSTYWGMAAALVLDRTLSEKAFLRPEFSAEMFAVFAKVHSFLKQLRQRTRNPEFMANVERVILNSKEARDRLRELSKRTAPRTREGVPTGSGIQGRGMDREGNRETRVNS